VTTLRVTSWDEFTLINRILQIRFIVFILLNFMQQMFNLFVNMIIVELSSTNNFFEIFHFVENDNRIIVDTKTLFENELNLVTANRILINKFVNYLLVQWDNNNYENYALWSITHDEFENWIETHFDQLNLKIWNDLRNFCYVHDFWINHNFEFDRINVNIMLNVIHVEWNNVWTFDQIKWIENRFETLSRVIRKRKHEFDDTFNFDDMTIYTHESNSESSRNIKNITFDDEHMRFTTFDDQHEMYSTLFVQSFYAYFIIRQHEYNYHSESESSTSIVFVVSIRASESASITQALQTLRVENQHVRSTSLSINRISNQHARSSSSFEILVSALTSRNSTSYVSTSIMLRITKSFFKKLSQLSKIYTLEKKFTNTNDNFDFKLRIFFNKCKRVELSSHAYMKRATFMLAKRALFHFYDNNYENITFDKFRVDMKKFFEKSKWKRYNLIKWKVMHIDNVIVANSTLFLIECFQKLCVDLDDVQKELNSDYHDSNQMRDILIRTCRDHSTLLIELHNSSSNFSDLINSLYNSIVNYESINKKNNTYLQSIDIIDCDHAHNHNFIDKQYHREFDNNRDNRRFSINSRSRDRFSIRASKKCFVCDKFNCWSTNHTEKKRDDFKKRFANRNLKWKSRQKFERRLKQFITEFEDNQNENFIIQFFEELNIDIDISFENISISEFVIELDSESESFFIVVDSIDDSKTISAIIIMLVDKTFTHRLIFMNNIIVSSNSISYIYNVFTASRYDNREFKNILIDHDAANFSSEDIEQFTILQRISKTTLILNKKRVISFKFDIDETLFIDIVDLKISVDVITFHIVFVQTSFLLCLVDMNRLRLYFNNLINMLIEEQSINKVLFRKELYATHSNQIKRFQTQILMSSKSLIRNDEIIFDLQINMKASQTINDLQINLKIKHSRRIDYLHINMKNEHHSMIRRYDHAFLLWKISAQSLITKSFDQNSCFFIGIELRRLYRRFDHFSTRRLQAILDRSDHEINFQTIEYFIKYCHHCQIHEKSSSRFSFTLKNDLEFNFNIIVNILYLKIKFDVNKSILHVMNETIRFQVDKWLKNIIVWHVWDQLRVCWIVTYLESLDLITSDANKQFIAREFIQYAINMNIKVNVVFVETHHSIEMIERYHEFLRRVYAIIVAKMSEIDSNSTLQMIFKTLNDSINLDDLIFTLLVFDAYFRMIEMNASSSIIIQRFIAMRKTMKEIRKSIVIRQLNDALNIRNDSSSILIYNLSLNSDILVYREKNDSQSESWKISFKLLNINDESTIIELSNDSTKFRSTMIKSYYDDNHLENSSLFISIIDFSFIAFISKSSSMFQ
jgi:hypothetical protein